MAMEKPRRLAVIGFGPRGLGALEALCESATRQGLHIEVDVYDSHPNPGAGPNFDPREPEDCLLNIPLRDIHLRAPDSLAVPTFAEWHGPASPDDFLPRARLGTYLQSRLALLREASAPHLKLTFVSAMVEALRPAGDGWSLQVDEDWCGPYADVLMVPGQPATRADDQLATWQTHAAATGATLAQAYPARLFHEAAEGWAGQTVAVRGFALSSFDVIRLLTTGLGGAFRHGRYIASGGEPACIIPFSLDGKPPYPKPESGEIDARFEPTPEETEAFCAAIERAAIDTPATAQAAVCAALSAPVLRILDEAGVQLAPHTIRDWLDTEWSQHGMQDTGTPMEVLTTGIAMAEGSRAPSIGYTVGQVWRKWQNPLRQGYNPAETSAETASVLVAFDEGLKRYSYGPPVDSCRQVLMLVAAGFVSLEYTADPGIALAEHGWRLSAALGHRDATVMVDAVLPSSDLRDVEVPVIRALCDAGWLTVKGEGLAASTAADGALVNESDQPAQGLRLLGRLALGSVIAADSLHDCFGQASVRWAEAVTQRMTR